MARPSLRTSGGLNLLVQGMTSKEEPAQEAGQSTVGVQEKARGIFCASLASEGLLPLRCGRARWARAKPTRPPEAIGHQVGTQAERAYRRADILEKRREIMKAWAQWCEPQTANVIPFGKAGA
jgi:hypothetical protein